CESVGESVKESHAPESHEILSAASRLRMTPLMDETKLRAWWFCRQGLDGSLKGKRPADILERAGWARSVGGAGPYLTLFARGGVTQAATDAAAARMEIAE